MKKRIVIATHAFYPRWDGITRYLNEIINYLVEDYEITVIAPKFPSYKKHIDNDPRIKIIRLPTYEWQLGDYNPPRFAFRKVHEVIKNADIVWVQGIMPIGMCAIISAKLLRKPLVATIHTIDWEVTIRAIKLNRIISPVLSGTVKFLGWIFYNLCDILIVPSHSVAELLQWHRIWTKKRVIHLGTDISKFRPPENKATSKSYLGIRKDEFMIGYIGRLGREKDLGTLYRAFARFNRKYKKSKLMIVGNGIEIYKKLFSKKKNIIYHPTVNNPIPFYQALDVYVLPSLTETTSLSTLEAMSCGLTVAATRVGFVKNYIIDGENGFFFTREDAYSLFKVLENIYKNRNNNNNIGANARQTVHDNFSWRKTAYEIKEVLDIFCE